MTKGKWGKYERRQQIIHATLKIVAHQGVTRFTTARLAEEVGISEAGIYKFYKNKEAILGDALEFVHDTLAHRLSSILDGENSAQDKLREILDFHLNFLEENQGIPRVVFSEQLYLGEPGLKDSFLSSMQRYFEMLKKLVQQGVEEGVFRPDLDLDMAVSTYFGLVQTTVFRWSLDNYNWKISGWSDRIYNFLLDCWS